MPLSRLFNTRKDALDTIAELKEYGLKESSVAIIDNSRGHVSEASMLKRGLTKDRAKKVVKEINTGAMLLVVEAPYAGAALATEILERRRPGDIATVKVTHEGIIWHDGAPLSSALRWPLLSRNPAPLSSMFGLPTLSRKPPSVKLIRKRSSTKLITSPPKAALIKKRSRVKLFRNPAPLSSLFGLPVVFRKRSGR